MKTFGFSLTKGVSLLENPDGCFLVSRVPVRMLHVNKALFSILKHIEKGSDFPKFTGSNKEKAGETLAILLPLVSKGYLNLDTIAEIEEYSFVSIIIPVRDQPEHLAECLKSLADMDYPKEQLEIIVIDDGSKTEIPHAIPESNITVIRHSESRGQSACRNTGAEKARGEILAFLDADCAAGKGWLKELIPFFQTSKVGAVGGYIEGYYKSKFLDRYEEVSSSLNMGKRIIIEGDTPSNFYIPTANMLVRRDVFMSTEGFKPDMRLGEDVDFCWRMRALDYSLIYVPYGNIAHKHRNRLFQMLKRRAEYGTSEATLYKSHREKKKSFGYSVFAGLSFLSASISILLMNPYLLVPIPFFFAIDLWHKAAVLKKYRTGLSLMNITNAGFRSYLSFFYFVFFHLSRYYLILITALGLLLHSLWLFGSIAIIFASVVDYFVKKPKLSWPVFLIFYILEHLAYQVGVFRGCLKTGYFRCYGVSFKRS